MPETVNIMKASLRVLTAISEKLPADPADVEILRLYVNGQGFSQLDELCCDAIQKALSAVRARVRQR